MLIRPTAIRANARRSRFRNTTQLARNRGGGTGGEYPMLQNEKSTDAFSKRLKGGAKRIARDAQIMSIFAAGDCRSDLFSDSLVHGVAKRARMSAIKRLINRLA
jgi:hypothetical protein